MCGDHAVTNAVGAVNTDGHAEAGPSTLQVVDHRLLLYAPAQRKLVINREDGFGTPTLCDHAVRDAMGAGTSMVMRIRPTSGLAELITGNRCAQGAVNAGGLALAAPSCS